MGRMVAVVLMVLMVVAVAVVVLVLVLVLVVLVVVVVMVTVLLLMPKAGPLSAATAKRAVRMHARVTRETVILAGPWLLGLQGVLARRLSRRRLLLRPRCPVDPSRTFGAEKATDVSGGTASVDAWMGMARWRV
jgi:hypothetical protein